MKKRILYLFIMLSSQMLQGQMILLQENFGGMTMPAGWYEDSAGVQPVIKNWLFSGFPNGVSGPGFDSSYLRANPALHDYSLVSPAFSTIGLSDVFLSYSDYHIKMSGANSYQKIEISTDGGLTWSVVFYHTGYGPYLNQTGYRKVVNLGTAALNQSNVRFRFHFKHNGGSYWAIDSVVVNDHQVCTTPTDTTGEAVSESQFLCSGIPGNFHIENLSRGIGQTYQWQFRPHTQGNYIDIPGAVHDTLIFAPGVQSYFRCLVMCNGDTAKTNWTMVADSPLVVPTLGTTYFSGICPGRTDTFYINCDKSYPGIGYQWQWSQQNGGPFLDIPGANDTLYALDASVFPNQGYIRCKQQCVQSGKYQATASSIVFENLNPWCYCIPYNVNDCSNMADFFGGIVNVSIAGTTLNNPSSTCSNLYGVSGYMSNYTIFSPTIPSQTATLMRNVPYALTVLRDTIVMWDIGGMWIDYNQNGYFEVTEYTQIDTLYWGQPRTTWFTIPATATPGLTCMRLRTAGNLFHSLNATMACTLEYGGETEDYFITIDTTVSNGQDLSTVPRMLVYPIPAQEEVTIQTEQPMQMIRIMGMDGVVIKEIRINKQTFYRMNMKDCVSGMYMLEVSTALGLHRQKIIRQ
jgi:hypothetical protein